MVGRCFYVLGGHSPSHPSSFLPVDLSFAFTTVVVCACQSIAIMRVVCTYIYIYRGKERQVGVQYAFSALHFFLFVSLSAAFHSTPIPPSFLQHALHYHK